MATWREINKVSLCTINGEYLHVGIFEINLKKLKTYNRYREHASGVIQYDTNFSFFKHGIRSSDTIFITYELYSTQTINMLYNRRPSNYPAIRLKETTYRS